MAHSLPIRNPQSDVIVVEPQRRARWSQADDDGLRGGRVALVGDAADGDERVGFWKVGRGATSRNFIRHDDEAACLARLALEVADEINYLTGGQPLLLHVVGVEKDDDMKEQGLSAGQVVD